MAGVKEKQKNENNEAHKNKYYANKQLKLIQGHSKKCSNNILESFRLPGVKSFCAVEYLDKELSLQIFKIFELHQVS